MSSSMSDDVDATQVVPDATTRMLARVPDKIRKLDAPPKTIDVPKPVHVNETFPNHGPVDDEEEVPDEELLSPLSRKTTAYRRRRDGAQRLRNDAKRQTRGTKSMKRRREPSATVKKALFTKPGMSPEEKENQRLEMEMIMDGVDIVPKKRRASPFLPRKTRDMDVTTTAANRSLFEFPEFDFPETPETTAPELTDDYLGESDEFTDIDDAIKNAREAAIMDQLMGGGDLSKANIVNAEAMLGKKLIKARRAFNEAALTKWLS